MAHTAISFFLGMLKEFVSFNENSKAEKLHLKKHYNSSNSCSSDENRISSLTDFEEGINFTKDLIREALERYFDNLDAEILDDQAVVSYKLNPQTIEVILPDETSIEFIEIPAGEFFMGSNETYQRPLTKVKVESFFMSVDPITIRQWNAVCCLPMTSVLLAKRLVSDKNDLDKPVTKVTYIEIQEFLHRLSKYSGLSIQIPSESMWEFACGQGQRTKYWSGDELPEHALIGQTVLKENTHNQPKNPFGLRGMHGTVHELTEDIYYPNHLRNSGNGQPVTS